MSSSAASQPINSRADPCPFTRLSVEETAAGVLRVANATMSRAIRVVSVERGIDPRGFALVAFGGCGGLHACEMAEELGMRTVLAPALAGSLSALGMLLADRIRDYAAGVLGESNPGSQFARLEAQARAETPGAKIERVADLRYLGQSYELTVPWRSRAAAVRGFHAAHQQTYGYANPSHPVEVVTIRLRARRLSPQPPLAPPAATGKVEYPTRPVFTGGRFRRARVLDRAAIGLEPQTGPLLVIDYGSTLLVPPAWSAQAGDGGSLILHRRVTG
jgi:N-methylhydantoinase A